MSESAGSAPEAASPQPETLSATNAVSKLSGLAQLALGSFATFSGLLYAMGYLLTLGQMRMLGAGSVDVSNQEIIRKVISIPLLSVVCAFSALFTVEGLLIGIALLLVCLNYERLGLFRQESHEQRKLGGLLLQWFAPLAVLIVISVSSTSLAVRVLRQEGLLLQQDVAARHVADETIPLQLRLWAYPIDDLLKLKSKAIASRQIYGFQVLALVFCAAVILGLWTTSRFANVKSTIRVRAGKFVLGLTALCVFLQFLNIPFLYGYLVMSTEFPAIETTRFPGEQAELRPKDAGIQLVILGTKGGKHVVYSIEHQQMWRGVTDGDLLPAIQLAETDPFVFDNPFPPAAQIKSVVGGLIDGETNEVDESKIPPEYWMDIICYLTPADKRDGLANSLTGEVPYTKGDGYQADWEEFGGLVITTQNDQVMRLQLFEVHDKVRDERDHFLAFKLAVERESDLFGDSAAETDSSDEEKFAGRSYHRLDRDDSELTLEAGDYYQSPDALSLRRLLGNDFSPKSAAEAEAPAEEN